MIAVTGATGHLGQWVVARLTELGHDVVCVCRRPSAAPSIDTLSWKGKVATLACDLSGPEAPAILRAGLAGIRAVVHLAAHVPEDTAAHDAAEAVATLRSNVVGTVRLLDALSSIDGLRNVVYASTFEVYGPPAAGTISEDHPTEPSSCYGASKLTAEKYVALFGADRGVASCSLRLPAIYGPGDALRRAVGNFVRAAAAGKPMILNGDGTDRRDLVTAFDAARAVALAVERSAQGVMNVGSGRGYSILEIATTVSQVAGGGVPIERRERVKPRLDYVLDTARVRDRLGWSPVMTLEEGLRAQLEWVRKGAS